jgi:hypothetical protein
MEIHFKHPYQVTIANLLWNAPDKKAVNNIVGMFGKHGQEVYYMIVAEYLDRVMDTDLAEEVIAKVK